MNDNLNLTSNSDKSKSYRIPVILVWLLCFGVIQGAQADEKTNVILVMADDIGYECYGAYGGTSYQTPVLDKLAREGARFTNAYSNPICTPTRIKLMTGLRNVRNYAAFGILRKSEKTFGHMMQEAGYKTAIAGKWQLYGAEHYKPEFQAKGALPQDAGFDRHCLWQVDKLGKRFWGPTVTIDGKLKKFDEDTYGPDIYTQFLLDRMEEFKDDPFFLYYPMALVHSPFVPTPDSNNRNNKNKQENFADMVAYMDKLVGKIVHKTEALGIAHKTLILVTGDNGTHKSISSKMGDKIIKGGKGSTTNAGNLVGFFAYQPNTIKPGIVIDDLIEFSDFLPTIAETTGAEWSSQTDGVSFYPQLLSKPGNPRKSIYVYYWPRPEKGEAKVFVRNKRWKLYGDGSMFDIHSDPLEFKPIDPKLHNKTWQFLSTELNTMPQQGQKILQYD